MLNVREETLRIFNFLEGPDLIFIFEVMDVI